jgi:hypothetical protein
MPWLIEKPSVVAAAGNVPRQIEEIVGRINSGHEQISVARMKSPAGWVEAGQTPEFMEITRGARGLAAGRAPGRQAARSGGRSGHHPAR